MADNRKLSTLLIKNLTREQYDSLLQRWKENEDLFLIVKAVLDQKKEESRAKQISLGTYDKPAWAEFQADANGYQRALTEVNTLLSLRDE